MTFDRWAERVLAGMGLPVNAETIAFMHAWARCEGGTARFNPLNTTLSLPAATNYNTAGVKHYSDATMGVAATMLTLRLGYYSGIRIALSKPGLTALEIAKRSATGIHIWGTNPSCVISELSV